MQKDSRTLPQEGPPETCTTLRQEMSVVPAEPLVSSQWLERRHSKIPLSPWLFQVSS